jgi:hypothetical protein
MALPSANRIAALGYDAVIVDVEEGWAAEARYGSPGHTVGPRVVAATPEQALGVLADWLEWHRDHAASLDALQAAQGTYDRLTAERAFGVLETEEARRSRRDALARVDALARHLAEIRVRQPRVIVRGEGE